jgi:hypothetical protein
MPATWFGVCGTPHSSVTGLHRLRIIGRPAFRTAALNWVKASAGSRFWAMPHRKSTLMASNRHAANCLASAS